MPTLEIPTRQNAETIHVSIPVTTGKGTENEKKSTFECDIPKDLASAIALYGEREVLKRFVNALVVFLQGKERNSLSRETKPRKRASYLESLGL